MATLSQRILVPGTAALAMLITSLSSSAGEGSSSANKRFKRDDPLWTEPTPRNVSIATEREIDPLYDFSVNSFGERRLRNPLLAAEVKQRATNTLDEAPDSAWYTNRHARRRMSIAELQRGPGNQDPPSPAGTWRVVSAKSDGVTPGFLIEDAEGRKFLLKFDPPRYPELASAADAIGSKFFYALGYNTPENYVVGVERERLTVDPSATYRDRNGRKRSLTEAQIDDLLKGQPRDDKGRVRALASRILPGQLLGPFRYEGVRTDDPNDLVPHEDRRDLRGLAVFAAWLNHTDAKSINTMDTVVEEGGRRYVRHCLIDFGAALGSDSFGPKDPRLGHEYFVDARPTRNQILTLGLYVPKWARVSYPKLTGVGHFEASAFDPLRWKPNYPNPAFSRMQADDAFWAAKQIIAFTDEEIRAMVQTGAYSDPRAAEYVAATLIQRRDKIGRAYLTQFLPLDRFRVEEDRLAFGDLAAEHHLGASVPYKVEWSIYDNDRGQHQAVTEAKDVVLPEPVRTVREGSYVAAKFRAAQANEGEPSRAVTVYLRKTAAGLDVAAIERTR